jgi:hypothetical protein
MDECTVRGCKRPPSRYSLYPSYTLYPPLPAALPQGRSTARNAHRKAGRVVQLAPKIRAEIKDFTRCCDMLFNGTPSSPLNAEEQELMIAYIARLKHKFSLAI